MRPDPLEALTFLLKDVLEFHSGANRLERRRAIHFINKELISPAYTDTRGSRRRYDYRAFVEFGIAHELVTGLGVPVPVAARILLELRRRGFFLMPDQYREIRALRKKPVHPAELREILREEYLLPLQTGVKYASIIVQGGTEVRSDPDERNPELVKKTTISRCLSLARPSPRPWPFYMMLRRRLGDWDFTFERLPQAKYNKEAASWDIQDREQTDALLSSVFGHSATLFLNLYRLERDLRAQLERRLERGAPKESGGDDGQI